MQRPASSVGSSLIRALALIAALVAGAVPPASGEGSSDQLQEITVTAERLRLIGSATTASEGVVVNAAVTK